MSLEIEKTTIGSLQSKLQKIPAQTIKLLIRQLTIDPVDFSQDIYLNLYQSIIRYCKEKYVHNVLFQSILKAITERAHKTHHYLGSTIQAVFADQSFKGAVKNAIQTGSNQKSYSILQSQNLFKPKSQQKGDKSGDSKLLQTCPNLLNRPQCFCEHSKQLKVKDDSAFKCIHCNKFFHTICMGKKSKSQFCCYCHLQRMIPIKKIVKTVYVGLLKKTKRRHLSDFQIPDIQSNQRLQFRCLRLKLDSQQACLFPDVAQLSINGQRCHLFQPINKHSCLKYRKDQPFNLLKGDYYKGQQNRLQVSELITTNRERDFRQEYQNHLIGLYVVEDLRIDQLINQTKTNNILGFSESHLVLQNSFGLGNDDQIQCQLVKIPLICPLTTVKIQIPTRGYYCTHFQCFDLKNYLTLISQSQNPRWKCPLCNSLAIQFKIDSILMQIIKQNKGNEKIKQILFFKNGEYCGIIEQQPLEEKKNIRNLNIPQKIKLRSPNPQPFQRQKPKRQLNFVIPENANIISLDD